MKSNDLVFDTGTLYGREKELQQLLSCWRRCCQDHHQELLVLRGKPGTGKSTLANALRLHLEREKPRPSGIFISGKFTENAVDEPYEVFVTALKQYVDQLFLYVDPLALENCCKVARETVGKDGGLLTSVAPALERIIGKYESPTTDRSFGTASLYRFHIAFANLVAVLTSVMPMVVFLDDLQWSDTASLNLMWTLMRSNPMALTVICGYRFCKCKEDAQSPHLLGTRPEQVLERLDHLGQDLVPFQSTLNDLMAESTIRVTLADLDDFEKKDISLLLSGVFRSNDLETSELADVILSHTEGNVFHIIQLIRFLVGRRLIFTREEGSGMQWHWDITQLRKSLESVESIFDLIREPLQGVSRIAQEVLKAASCLGDEIDDSALCLILQTPTAAYLEEAANEGLLTFQPCSGGYRFSHDWIRAAAFDMIPEEERDEFHLKVGRRLWQGSTSSARADNIIQITKIMNKGIRALREPRERMKLAELNLKAGKRARTLNSFPDSARFLSIGISMLGLNSWRDCYALSLDLYSTAAEVEATNGNFELVIGHIQEVITHAVDIDDKIQAYETLLRVMPQQGNIQETILTAVEVLKQLGERLPPVATKFAAVKELARVKMILRGKSDKDILELPCMTDKKKIACVRILNLITITCYEGRSQYTAIAAFRLIQFTMKYGLHNSSGLGFAFYAAILCGYGDDVNVAHRYGQLGVSLAERDSTRLSVPMTHYILGSLVRHWSRPIREFTFDDLAFADKKALEIGQIENSLAARNIGAVYSIFAGSTLNSVKAILKDNIRIARLYRQRKSEMTAALPLQMIHCLQGSAPHPGRLTGTVVDIEDYLSESIQLDRKLHIMAARFYSFYVAFFAGDLGYALKSIEQIPHQPKLPQSTFFGPVYQYHRALALIADARQRSCNKCSSIKQVKQILHSIQKRANGSPANFSYMQILLEAELMGLNRHYCSDKMSEWY